MYVRVCTAQIIRYPTLLQALRLDSIRDLEDLVIEAVYAGIICAKLDQRCQLLIVEQAISRDLLPAQVRARGLPF